jgi:hypothetical protein
MNNMLELQRHIVIQERESRGKKIQPKSRGVFLPFWVPPRGVYELKIFFWHFLSY